VLLLPRGTKDVNAEKEEEDMWEAVEGDKTEETEREVVGGRTRREKASW
jgi:hypothetical protein